jgi:hypothetical protein
MVSDREDGFTGQNDSFAEQNKKTAASGGSEAADEVGSDTNSEQGRPNGSAGRSKGAPTAVEITLFEKSDGPLTKSIKLNGTGIFSDGADCRMSRGVARRTKITSVEDFASLTAGLAQNQAWGMGALRDGLPDEVTIVTKRKLKQLRPGANAISRTRDYLAYRPGQPALMPIDFDSKGMTPEVFEKLKGGIVEALAMVMPAVTTTARVLRRSTSAGLRRTDTDAEIPGSNSLHLYLVVIDAADIERALRVLHDRCWLAGLGWIMPSRSGALLERSVIDRLVGDPARLFFEAPPIVSAPLWQDPELRRPVAFAGTLLDTRAALPDLNPVELSRLEKLKAIESARVAPEAAKRHTRYMVEEVAELVATRRLSESAARTIVIKRLDGVLLPDVVLPWDDDDLEGVTVGDVLRDPLEYEGCTLADPLARYPEYGRGKAKVMIQYDGTPLIHSFAGGTTVYRLLWDLESTRAAIERQTGIGAVDTLLAYDARAEFTGVETQQLVDLVAKLSGLGKQPIKQDLKKTREEASRKAAAERRKKELATNTDRRPRRDMPLPDTERLPVMRLLNDVLGQAKDGDARPMRGYDGYVTQARMTKLLSMHALTPGSTNAEETEESQLPAPEQMLLHQLSPHEVEEMIERYIQFYETIKTEFGEIERTVVLPDPFIQHYVRRHDGALPTVTGVVTMPLVLEDGTLLVDNGLHEDSGLLFRIPDEMLKWIPKKEQCTPAAVKDAMDFLTNEWLVDVLTDYQGKCVLVVLALTIIERNLIASRPVFTITAGRRGGGKTTTILMIVMAVLGVMASAAAWSSDVEERRKALLAYLLTGLAVLVWDNIPLGLQVFCQHIERACTALYYVDRKLGVSETPTAPATTVQVFTGNNIGTRGDLASRTLSARLQIDRTDPENREVVHQDPIGWTEANRGKILRSLYTILLGNPALGDKDVKLKTRFKQWWRLCGSAVENAAQDYNLDFARLFAELEAEQEDDEIATLLDAALALYKMKQGRKEVSATDIADAINNAGVNDDGWKLRSVLFPIIEKDERVTAKSVGRMMRKYIGHPVEADGGVIYRILKNKRCYQVEVIRGTVAAPAQGDAPGTTPISDRPIAIGDMVEVEIDGELAFPDPVRVRDIIDSADGPWLFVEGSETGLRPGHVRRWTPF